MADGKLTPNPLSEKSLADLDLAMRWSIKKLAPFRQRRLWFVREYLGKHHGVAAASKEQPVNFAQLATDIYLRQMIAGAPRALVTTPYEQLKHLARKATQGVNHQIEEIALEGSLRTIVKDAIFCVGIAKIALEASPAVTINDRQHEVGKPFVDPISIDNFVLDMTAHRWQQIDYAANRYRVPYDAFMQSPQYKNKDDLSPTRWKIDQESSETRTETIVQGDAYSDESEWRKRIELWDVFSPADNLIFTIADQKRDQVLAVRQWEGPAHGPFRMLAFHANEVPDSIMPLAPLASLIDLHGVGNELFRKISQQARDQKTVTAVAAGEEANKDARNIRDAADGEIIKVRDPKNVQELRYRGVDGPTLAFFLQIRQLFSYFGGNLDVMGGMRAESPTLGQDIILQQSSSQKLAGMQESVVAFTRDLIADLGWYMWTDPLLNVTLTRKVPGLGERVERLRAMDLVGRFGDFNFKIEPYSLQRHSPSERMGLVMNLVTTTIIPLIGLFAQQGIQVKLGVLMKLIAEYVNLPELLDVLEFHGQPAGPAGPIVPTGEDLPMRAPNQAPRERTSRGGMSMEGSENEMMSSLLSNRAPGMSTLTKAVG